MCSDIVLDIVRNVLHSCLPGANIAKPTNFENNNTHTSTHLCCKEQVAISLVAVVRRPRDVRQLQAARGLELTQRLEHLDSKPHLCVVCVCVYE